jgi:hypothetical protein
MRAIPYALSFSLLASMIGGCGPTYVDEEYIDDHAGTWGALEDPNGLAALLTCPDRDPAVRSQVKKLVDGLSLSGNAVTSLDAFVGTLPLQMRQNVMFWTETRALQRIYSYDHQLAMLQMPRSVSDRSFHNQGGKWCVAPKAGGQDLCLESRVLLSSTDGDIIGTFVTDPESPSKGSFEMAMFDPTQDTLDYFDIRFADGTAPVVTKNPDECMKCHGGRDGAINWRMDPYRMWAYATPFLEDNLRKGSVEAEWYLSFLDRIASGESVLRHLKPYNDKQTIVDALKTGDFQLKTADAAVDFSSIDTPALNVSHQLLEKNACRIAGNLARRPDFNQLKYAAIGALINCKNVDDFFPTTGGSTRARTEQHFADQRLGMNGDRFDLNALLSETQAKHVRLLNDRLSRRFDHMTQYAGEETADAEIRAALVQAPRQAGYGVNNYEIYSEHITKARYLLEPFGIDVANWSMAVDSEANSHVEFLYLAANQPVFLDVLEREFKLSTRIGRKLGLTECYAMGTDDGTQGLSHSCEDSIKNVSVPLCADLAAKSREVLAAYTPTPDHYAGTTIDDKTALEAEARTVASSKTLSELTSMAGSVYSTYCAGCHQASYTKGAWVYPFDDIDQMNDLLRREKTASITALESPATHIGVDGISKGGYDFDYVSTGDRIWDRVTRHPRQHGIMPRFSQKGLPHSEKVTLRAHMLKLWEAQ